ncbi:hypothetical protein [Arthrobacter sp. SDTb3-6]|uniref:hypothetical protein n=1 Tax=Arthrobacter sp. SDTb3-6 TaxID=2713571 RepID=UPI00159E6750|nr:hypothetical protein [Arthrobacter sp. SDTb3-6]NVM99924.1 hypothetical protein [Arthrobacter sp. SDTb3-6]
MNGLSLAAGMARRTSPSGDVRVRATAHLLACDGVPAAAPSATILYAPAANAAGKSVERARCPLATVDAP